MVCCSLLGHHNGEQYSPPRCAALLRLAGISQAYQGLGVRFMLLWQACSMLWVCVSITLSAQQQRMLLCVLPAHGSCCFCLVCCCTMSGKLLRYV